MIPGGLPDKSHVNAWRMTPPRKRIYPRIDPRAVSPRRHASLNAGQRPHRYARGDSMKIFERNRPRKPYYIRRSQPPFRSRPRRLLVIFAPGRLKAVAGIRAGSTHAPVCNDDNDRIISGERENRSRPIDPHRALKRSCVQTSPVVLRVEIALADRDDIRTWWA